MASLTNQPQLPLTLSDQLDAMLLGWLERRAESDLTFRPDQRARAVITVGTGAVPEIRRFCAKWDLSVELTPGGGSWAALVIEGPSLPVQGFAEITRLYRR